MIITQTSKTQYRYVKSYRNLSEEQKKEKKSEHLDFCLVTVIRFMGIPLFRRIEVVTKDHMGGSPFLSNLY